MTRRQLCEPLEVDLRAEGATFFRPPRIFAWSLGPGQLRDAVSGNLRDIDANAIESSFDAGAFADVPVRIYCGRDGIGHPPNGDDSPLHVVGRARAVAFEGDRVVGSCAIDSTSLGVLAAAIVDARAVLSTIDEKSRRLGFSPVCTMVSYGGPIELLRDVTFDIAERPLLRSYLFELSGR